MIETTKAITGYDALITRQGKGLIHEMEKLFAIWFDNQIAKQMSMSLDILQSKARTIFSTLKALEGEECTETSTANHGWFQQFHC